MTTIEWTQCPEYKSIRAMGNADYADYVTGTGAQARWTAHRAVVKEMEDA